MRALFVPEHLSPLHLVGWDEVSTALRSAVLDEVLPTIEEGVVEERPDLIRKALEWLDTAYQTAWQGNDRYGAALVRLCQSDLQRRLGNWDEALDFSVHALTWIRSGLTQLARYNEAVAMYNQALVRCIVPAPAGSQALELLTRAQDQFNEARKLCGYHGNRRCWENCTQVIGWIERLRALHLQCAPDDALMLVPVYSCESTGRLQLESAVWVPERSGSLLSRMEDPTPSRIIVLGEDRTRIQPPEPGVDYFGLRVPENGEWVSQSRKDDVLLLRRATPRPLGRPDVGEEQPFMRLPGGRIAFICKQPAPEQAAWLVGIPEALLRGIRHDQS